MVTIFARINYKHIQILQTLQGYIFQALYNFATTFCNFTNFIMFFLVIPFSYRGSQNGDFIGRIYTHYKKTTKYKAIIGQTRRL